PGRTAAASLRRVVPVAAPGQADAAENLVARARPGAAVPHAAAVARRATCRPAGPGAELRAGVPRFVDHLRGEGGRGATPEEPPTTSLPVRQPCAALLLCGANRSTPHQGTVPQEPLRRRPSCRLRPRYPATGPPPGRRTPRSRGRKISGIAGGAAG